MNHIFKYFVVFIFSYLVVWVLTPLFIKLAPRIGLMDTPDERCIHEAVTPLGGGVVIFIAFNLSIYLIDIFYWPNVTGHLNTGWWSAFIVASAFLLVVDKPCCCPYEVDIDSRITPIKTYFTIRL